MTTIKCDSLDALNDPVATTNRWNRIPLWNWKLWPSVLVMVEGVMVKGTTAKASFKMYLILKLHTTLPGL